MWSHANLMTYFKELKNTDLSNRIIGRKTKPSILELTNIIQSQNEPWNIVKIFSSLFISKFTISRHILTPISFEGVFMELSCPGFIELGAPRNSDRNAALLSFVAAIKIVAHSIRIVIEILIHGNTQTCWKYINN